jgi:hypothetical protein
MSEGAQTQDPAACEYNGSQQNSASNNTVTLQGKSVSVTGKAKTAVQTRAVMKSSFGRKPRPIPMLQCIQQSGKLDGNAAMPMSVDRDEDDGGGEESNNSSLAPEHVSKSKVELPHYMPWRCLGYRRYSSYSSLILALGDVGGQCPTPAMHYPRERNHRTH